jgi:hypothetical protein
MINETEFLNEQVFLALRPGRSYPKDIAYIAEGALVYEALLRYGWGDRGRLKDRMCALLTWAIRNMQKRDGRFLCRKYPLFGVDLKSIRWGQGMMLVALASAMAHLIPAARAVNDGMPLHVTELLINASSRAGIAIEDAKVAVLGYAYLKNSDDTRNSPSEVLVARLRELGAEVVVHDSYVPEYQGDLMERVRGCDAVVLMVAHDGYRALDLSELRARAGRSILVDGRNMFSAERARAAGWDYRGVGRG